MADQSILRLGPITGTDNCGAAFLREAIRRNFDGGANDDIDQSTLTISNRYFTANVALLGLDEPTYSDNVSSSSRRRRRRTNNVNNNKHGSITTVEEDGILLVFDDQSSHSFDSLGCIHDEIVVGSAIGDLLRMCIGTHVSSTNDDDDDDNGGGGSTTSIINKDEYSRRVLWCLDRGYEYVSVDLSTHGMTTGFNMRDKDGYARVIEAIETCMWSCRVMKSSRPGGGIQNSSSVQQQRAAKGGSGGAVGRNNNIDDAGVTMSDDTAIMPLMTDDERESAAIASLMNGTANDDDDDDDYMPPSLGEGGELQSQSIRRQHQQQQKTRDEEISFHQLEKVLTDAKSIREASRNNANMSDEERRARAGDAAMKLMGLLDRLGFDDEESDDGEDVGDCDSDDRELTGS